MKKLIAIVLATVLLLSLAACGGKAGTGSTGGNSDPAQTNSENVVTEQPNGAATEKPTKEEFLASYGLTEDDLKPAGFIEMNAWSCENNEGDFFIQVDEASRGVAEIEEWFIKVFDKLKSLSDDGKIYEDPALTQEATYPSYNSYLTNKMFIYLYKGQKVYVDMRFSLAFENLKDEIKNKAQYEFYINLYQ